jgi:hypothetical protein
MQHTIETPKQYQCRHIFTDGRRCASPCLRQEEFCYYHHTTRRPIANPRQRRSRRSTFHLPLPEDRSAIQASIGEVLQRIAANDIDPRRAGLLLYGLQIASLNLPKIPREAIHETESQTVEEIITDPELGILAPRTEVSEIATYKSPVAQLIERILQGEQEEEEEEEEEATPEPATIPTLQATVDNPSSPVRLPHNRKIKRRRHPDRSEAQWRDPRISLLSLSVLFHPTQNTVISTGAQRSGEIRFSNSTAPPAPTRGSNTPCPPARRAYKQSSPWRQASDRHRVSRIPGPQNPCSWSQ